MFYKLHDCSSKLQPFVSRDTRESSRHPVDWSVLIPGNPQNRGVGALQATNMWQQPTEKKHDHILRLSHRPTVYGGIAFHS